MTLYPEQYTRQKKGRPAGAFEDRPPEGPSLFPAPTGFLHFFRLAPGCLERRKSLSSSTRRLDLALVRPLFTVAFHDWAMELGPQFTARTLPKVRNSRNLRLSPGEAEAIVRSTGSPVLEKLLRFALETAMRRNEITKMRGGECRSLKKDGDSRRHKKRREGCGLPLAGGCQDP